MSVVVAIKENGIIYMGSDSQVTTGGTRSTLGMPNNYKIWKVRNSENCIMGSVGRVRDAIPVRLMDDIISGYAEYKDAINFEYVARRVFPSIIEELKNWKYLPEKDTFESLDSTFLFAYRDQLYHLCFDGTIIEVDDFVAIGSGAEAAIGSLLTSEGADPRIRIIEAIKASAVNNLYVDYPIILTNTKDCRFDVIQEEDVKAIEARVNKKIAKDKETVSKSKASTEKKGK